MPDEDQLFLSPATPSRSNRADDLYGLQDDLDFIKGQLVLMPTRREIWRATLAGIVVGSTLTIVLALAFWH
jgi:hypothetical protein